MAYEIFRSQMGSMGDDTAFRGVSGWENDQSGAAAFGTQSAKNAQLLSNMAGANLQGLGEIMQAKDTANAWREMQRQQEQRKKKSGLFGGILDVASTALGFIPGIGTAAKIGIGLATQGAKGFLG